MPGDKEKIRFPWLWVLALLVVFGLAISGFYLYSEGVLDRFLFPSRNAGPGVPVVEDGKLLVKLLWCRPGTLIEHRKRRTGEKSNDYFKKIKKGEVVAFVGGCHVPAAKNAAPPFGFPLSTGKKIEQITSLQGRGSGASLKCSYLPSIFPTATVAGMITRLTNVGISGRSYSLR